ncbi:MULTISPECIES: 3-isopropylmalate dehydratase small subunit [Candidatus Neomicrothrix]|jgi:3-isopropylmalate/(R)-2-methylmalate dehydratase small subunit|uniref:3-isopropylmalate dehydratase small subunit n=1 Tax=Candidatus Neomicrothrix parvicella RN1 TaxID=1229780 RepID=R4Z7J2_9ACTN|nr:MULTISPECIES: 3-isopropylmalate dehydratase small subunit [Microthrix]NLH66851.1 3-isopropylmalate dehydratase small subunit [Candidatus Microthrix parvicella]MBK6503368.1 3-isopropylmalate dehydratase small subunit [Candidatus Microthrix sp.]MBK7018135.1 3-isopropylmalate dehydratase small subunit [Candidatus Microthrix sp.]MBK7323463.1 3-isopropylmalate dehydratase small subunit [Candidatus Microthrix sp.]MBL0204845.1 3-isopropylmalate dehydratase small subunit [Candidatus Microthrix sp.]
MDPVRIISGRAVPLDRSDVDTDQIIPSDWLKRVERNGFDRGLFSEWRDDRNFVLNDERYQGANILVAGPNFGTGSSREHAVWALQQYGFDAVISPRFGPIFVNNATKVGLVPVTVSFELGERLLKALEEDPTLMLEIDVEAATVEVQALGVEESFTLEPSAQYRLVNGLDDISLTLSHTDAIDAFEARRPVWMPSLEAAG